LSRLVAFLLTASSAELQIRVQIGAAAEEATVVEGFSCELVGEFEVTFLMEWLACYKHQLLFLDGKAGGQSWGIVIIFR
jgi:hypothetical protein